MNDFGAIGSALYSRLGTVTYTYPTQGTVTTTGSVGTYDTLSHQGSATPYVIFQHETALDTYTFGTVSGVSADYMVKAVSNRQTPLQAQAIYAKAHDTLQDAPLTIAGSYPLRVRRTSTFQFRDSDSFWHVGGIYRVDYWHNS